MYKKILVPIDDSGASRRGLAEAVKIAKSQGASLRLLHVVDEYVLDIAYERMTFDGRLIEALRESGRKILNEAESLVRASTAEVETVIVEAVGGRVADQILEQAQQWPADLIVMGTHGRRGIRRLVMGSDAEQVVRSSPVPILLVRESTEAAA